MPSNLQIKSFAKLNLILRVKAVDSSGLHPICSWMHAVDLFDEINLQEPKDRHSTFDTRWSSGDPVEWDIKDDLVYKAHAALERWLGWPLPVDIQVLKSIPAGGGLGGGSSNAAAVLMGCNQFFDLGLNEASLCEIARKIGTDISYFIDLKSFAFQAAPEPAVVAGIGDQITRTSRVDSKITLLIPDFGCSTGSVYKAFDSISDSKTFDSNQITETASTARLDPAHLINDLSAPARSITPALDQLMSHLDSTGLKIHLSGSGSTLFVIGHLDQPLLDSLRSGFSAMKIIETCLC